ncbi:hypothetical protein A2331_05650 [Candidatus Falkowbacteria bacterium RIFOXYB2_FULL_34_18]|uniref:Radical SAM core domain-containing protein n=1 Tax=Candidatus Falkowbacteria bacterium RIFOXYD2_FULL_34_120 TaxID=1798007 RepID=A0A1F5TRF4_9BACT|nr:MAG: hypothetical protein A2331_05650 [Candidatus Falkowbacteria bacterium RIFOXYB2_FULL_34_18]OGF29807.1 MAG: hypothetical protein A2500_01380 [Candidatus Falkowbacteria bacterium RIFOXYC12_FULL_34_55]OGF37078.1 MAG: hypothetical protein A2466_05825 [Candidatus Falkowbacteria bacterium RIFOXYC2_FULL_34_220]OGF39270.1 MAG: hypothetical protein A2515_01035 [Candidatus Falkowbacteria bacterium RIFOXYD12_FULL_34_57]OGF41374.1 MAG: hypothetical protein A2531_07240 [Candidatus Falkowbacteria bact
MIKKNLPKLDFNVTNRCNFRCIHCCFRSGERLLEEFSLEKIKEVLNDFISLGGKRIDITGGEPLLRNDIFDIVKFAKSLNLKVELVTNASLLNKSKLERFKRIGLDDIAISLDGVNYDTYSRIRPINKRTHDYIIENIKECVRQGFYTKINTVVFRSNFQELIKINDFAIKIGVSEHGLYYFTPVGRGNDNKEEIVDPFAWLELAREKFIPRQNKIKLSLETPILETKNTKKVNISCYLENPWHLQLLPDGNVYPCAIMAFYNRPCGNLYEKSLKDIWYDKKLWNGEYYQQNVMPLINKYKSCINFGKKFKDIIKKKNYKFVCLMCKCDCKQLKK